MPGILLRKKDNEKSKLLPLLKLHPRDDPREELTLQHFNLG